MSQSSYRHNPSYSKRSRLRRLAAAIALQQSQTIGSSPTNTNASSASSSSSSVWTTEQWNECYKLVHDSIIPVLIMTPISTAVHTECHTIEEWYCSYDSYVTTSTVTSSSSAASTVAPVIRDANEMGVGEPIRRIWKKDIPNPTLDNMMRTSRTINRNGYGPIPDRRYDDYYATNEGRHVFTTGRIVTPTPLMPYNYGLTVEGALAMHLGINEVKQPQTTSVNATDGKQQQQQRVERDRILYRTSNHNGLSLHQDLIYNDQWMVEVLKHDYMLPNNLRLLVHSNDGLGITLWTPHHDILQRATTTITPITTTVTVNPLPSSTPSTSLAAPSAKSSTSPVCITTRAQVTHIRDDASYKSTNASSPTFPHASLCGSIIWSEQYSFIRLLTADIILADPHHWRSKQLFSTATGHMIRRASVLDYITDASNPHNDHEAPYIRDATTVPIRHTTSGDGSGYDVQIALWVGSYILLYDHASLIKSATTLSVSTNVTRDRLADDEDDAHGQLPIRAIRLELDEKTRTKGGAWIQLRSLGAFGWYLRRENSSVRVYDHNGNYLHEWSSDTTIVTAYGDDSLASSMHQQRYYGDEDTSLPNGHAFCATQHNYHGRFILSHQADGDNVTTRSCGVYVMSEYANPSSIWYRRAVISFDDEPALSGNATNGWTTQFLTESLIVRALLSSSSFTLYRFSYIPTPSSGTSLPSGTDRRATLTPLITYTLHSRRKIHSLRPLYHPTHIIQSLTHTITTTIVSHEPSITAHHIAIIMSYLLD
jgi:hypothetical protein